jgi:hypothetical protein
MPIDYSRAWIVNGFPLPNLPLNADMPTIYMQRDLSSRCGRSYILPDQARWFCEQMKLMSVERISDIIRSHPKEWLPARTRTSILKWWRSPERIARLDGIALGIENGDYL